MDTPIRLTLIQDSCKEVGVKLGTLKGMTGLQPVVPLLQHPHGEGGELVGLIQVSTEGSIQ